MSKPNLESSPPARSYCGIAAWICFLVPSVLISMFAFITPTGTDKMQGFEFVVILPATWALHLFGVILGAKGMKDAEANPLSLSGTIVNVIAVPGQFVSMWLAAHFSASP